MSGRAALLVAGLPLDASADGWRIDALFQVAAWLVLAVGVFVVAWLALVLVRDRDGGAAPGGTGRRRDRRLVAVGLTTVVFVAVDGTLFWGSTRDLAAVFLRADEAEAEPGAVRVEVNAHQWSWGFRHPGVDEAFGTADDVVTLDRLVVPRGRPVILEVASADVVHGLYLPAFRVKIDAVPGRIQRTWFRPARTGRFELGCSQFCGVAHYQMLGVVDVLEPVDFAAWLEAGSVAARRVAREDERARAEEPGRLADPLWPSFSRDPATSREWAWPWGQGR